MSETNVIVASTMQTSMLCTSQPQPGHDPDYEVIIVGANDPAAVGGTGITYNVDQTSFNWWVGEYTDYAPFIQIVTQAQVDALTASANQYGFQAGLSGTRDAASDPHAEGIKKAQTAVDDANKKLAESEKAVAADQRAVSVAEVQLKSAINAPPPSKSAAGATGAAHGATGHTGATGAHAPAHGSTGHHAR